MARCDDHRGGLNWKSEESEKNGFCAFSSKVACCEDWNAWIDGTENSCR